ncbi:hypothetical protein [Amphibacillus cookii]|uniref:hypothetical protein n=1 Tax=Amphibacillus cookii TaxID=767787 RepID=UPI00195BA03F|nr:hypothetical protein [Amphibacillus cookii]MBM7542610.1 hypothetical protein [Amphibacillus cookii]
MQAFWGLLKKDHRLARLNIIFFSILLALLLTIGYVGSVRLEKGAGAFMAVTMAALAMMAFMPVMMGSLLIKEGKTQLWLYSPRPSHTLLISKIAVLLLYQVLLQLIVVGYLMLSLHVFGQDVLQYTNMSTFTQLVVMTNIGLILIGIYLTTWVLFYWTLYRSMDHMPKIKNVRWLLILFLYFGYNYLETQVAKIPFIQRLVARYQLPIISNPLFVNNEGSWFVEFESVDVPIIYLLYSLALTVLLFSLASMLLTKKVEV